MSAVLKIESGYTGYTLDDKREAFAHYQIHGNLMQVSRDLNIPHTTLHDWQHSDWWVAEAERVRRDVNDALDARLTQLIEKTTKEIEERIDNGDEKLTKAGELVRIRVSARDLAVTTAIIFDKRQILRALPTTISANSGQLDSLAANLLKLKQAEGKQPSVSKSKSIA